MTVRINKPALNLREELTKAQGVVRYEQRQFWMDGLVENGTFDSDTSGWTATGSSVLAIDASRLKVTNGSSITGGASYRLTGLVTGKSYRIYSSLVIGNTAVIFRVRDQNGSSILVTSNVSSTTDLSLSFTAISDAVDIQSINGDSTQGDFHLLDNVKVFEVDENDNVIHSVPLGFKPVHVYEDGLLQREGANYDYTVVNTGFGYQIKPTVAPSATTETCIIAEREL